MSGFLNNEEIRPTGTSLVDGWHWRVGLQDARITSQIIVAVEGAKLDQPEELDALGLSSPARAQRIRAALLDPQAASRRDPHAGRRFAGWDACRSGHRQRRRVPLSVSVRPMAPGFLDRQASCSASGVRPWCQGASGALSRAQPGRLHVHRTGVPSADVGDPGEPDSADLLVSWLSDPGRGTQRPRRGWTAMRRRTSPAGGWDSSAAEALGAEAGGQSVAFQAETQPS